MATRRINKNHIYGHFLTITWAWFIFELCWPLDVEFNKSSSDFKAYRVAKTKMVSCEFPFDYKAVELGYNSSVSSFIARKLKKYENIYSRFTVLSKSSTWTRSHFSDFFKFEFHRALNIRVWTHIEF